MDEIKLPPPPPRPAMGHATGRAGTANFTVDYIRVGADVQITIRCMAHGKVYVFDPTNNTVVERGRGAMV